MAIGVLALVLTAACSKDKNVDQPAKLTPLPHPSLRVQRVWSASVGDKKAVAEEVMLSRRLCARHNWPIIYVTRLSIEETAAAVLKLLADRRRLPVSAQ